MQECLLIVLAARRVGRRQAADVRGYDDDRLDVDVDVVVILVALRRRHNLLLLARVNCEQQTTTQNDDVTTAR